MPYHRDKREACGFCRQPLPDNIWKELDAHFSKESSQLENDLEYLIKNIESEVDSLKTITDIERSSFDLSIQNSFEEENISLKSSIKLYKKELKEIADSLTQRKKDLFNKAKCPDIKDNEANIIKVDM